MYFISARPVETLNRMRGDIGPSFRGSVEMEGCTGTPPSLGQIVCLPPMSMSMICVLLALLDGCVSEKRRSLSRRSMAQTPDRHLHCLGHLLNSKSVYPFQQRKKESDPPNQTEQSNPNLRGPDESYTSPQPLSHTDAQCGERPKMVRDNAMPSLSASTNKVTDLPQQRRDKARHTYSCPEPILTLPTTPGPGPHVRTQVDRHEPQEK